MNRRNWFWGAFFILAAVVILLNQAVPFLAISPFKLLITICLLMSILTSIPKREFGGILVPAAILYVMYYKMFRWILPFSGPSVVIAAILLSIGLSFIFKKKHYHYYSGNWGGHHQRHQNTDQSFTGKNVNEDIIHEKVVFGGESKYIHSTCLERADFGCTFGGLKIYFDQATLGPNGADIIIDASFSGVELYVPHDWEVVDDIHTAFSGVSVKGRNTAVPGQSPQLRLKGNIQFSGVDVVYV